MDDLSDLHCSIQLEALLRTSTQHDWQEDRQKYTLQQIGKMPTWIKVQKEQASTSEVFFKL